jgi:predicted dehydrogenase
VNTVKLAVIGTGHLGRIHARLAAGLENVQLVGVVDPVSAARDAVAEEVGARPCADYRDLLGEIDAAILATPTATHHQIGMDLLNHGVHLLVEKPIAFDVAQADELIGAARRQGLVLQVGHVERFNPALARVLPHVHEPKYIEAKRVSGFPFRSTDIGVVHDLMIHDLDVILSLVRSPVARVEAMGVAVLGQHEDTANARVVFENGCVANITASRVSYAAERTMQIWCAESFASIDFGLRTTTVVEPREDILQRRFSLESLTGEEKAHLKRHLFDELLKKETVEGAEGNALLDEQRDFADSILSARTPRVSGEAGRDALALAGQILECIDQHAWDGNRDGRMGPRVAPPEAVPILRGPHWNLSRAPQTRRHKEAG